MIDFKDILNQDVRNPESVDMVGDDFIILDSPQLTTYGRFPFKNDWLIATFCEEGSASGAINLREYKIESGGFIIILPGQVIVRSLLSDDFQGKIVLMSRRFSDSLDIGRTLTITASIESRPYYELQGNAIEIVRSYISSCKAMIRQNGDSTACREALRLLSRAFFVGTGEVLTKFGGDSSIGPYSHLTEDFLSLVEKDYRGNRQLAYYAGKLGRSAKYLSRRVKEDTGQNATDWIDRCVIMDAQAQLLTTKKTIAEISDSLGFPSQSFFGKYFKRVTGHSPRDFVRKEGFSCLNQD